MRDSNISTRSLAGACILFIYCPDMFNHRCVHYLQFNATICIKRLGKGPQNIQPSVLIFVRKSGSQEVGNDRRGAKRQILQGYICVTVLKPILFLDHDTIESMMILTTHCTVLSLVATKQLSLISDTVLAPIPLMHLLILSTYIYHVTTIYKLIL